jgi:ubiquinone/menaquinone biosynthesis C-methylase UbiE
MSGPSRSVAFDRVAHDYDRTRGGPERAAQVVAESAPLLPPDDPLLEIGVGTGLIADALARQGRAVAGVDLSLPMLRLAVGRMPGRVATGDALRLPIRSGSVAGVVMIHVLHVVGDVDAALAEAGRVVRPAGRIVVSTFDGTPPTSDVGKILEELGNRVGRADERPDTETAVTAAATRASLTWAGRIRYRPSFLRLSPAMTIERVITRSWSWMWQVDEQAWPGAAEAAVDALRRLPDPDRARTEPGETTLLAFEPGQRLPATAPGAVWSRTRT